MPSITIPNEIATDYLLCGSNHAPYEIMEDTIVGKSRWTLQHRLIIKDTSTGRFYRYYYDEGATEYQDVDYPSGDVEFIEVGAMPVTVIQYKEIE